MDSKKTEVKMNSGNGKTNHFLLAFPEKSAKSASLMEWASILTIAVAFIGIAVMYMQP